VFPVLQETTNPRAETIYAFDVVARAPAPSSSTGSSSGSDSGSAAMPRLGNRRVFAVTQSTKPDGIKVDSNGNGERRSQNAHLPAEHAHSAVAIVSLQHCCTRSPVRISPASCCALQQC
jgi:hypothetical protein